jgi:polyisoprenoid-binding protein YceI
MFLATESFNVTQIKEFRQRSNLTHMKTKHILLAWTLLLAGNIILSQKVEVNTTNSNVTWLGKKIGSNHEGNIQLMSGYLEIKDDKIIAGDFVIDMTTITNSDIKKEDSNQQLIGHLKSSDFFGVETYPTATFVVTQGSTFRNGKATVSGDITIKNHKEHISFEVVRAGKEFTATVEIDRTKFDVRYNSNSFFDNLGDKAINNIFTLDIQLFVI